MSLLAGTMLIAASNTNGASLSPGAASAMGLVPNRASAPNVGLTLAGHDDMVIPIMSCSKAIIA